jgi:hypothetical protein
MDGQAVFREEADYLAFLRLFKQAADEGPIAVIAYSLLPNHYHCLLRQDGETPVGQALRRVEAAYASDGVAFESSGRAMKVATESDFLTLCVTFIATPCTTGWSPRRRTGSTPITWNGSIGGGER